MRVLVAGAADWRGAPGIMPGPGGPSTAGLPAAPPATGGSPPVGRPFCASASEVPATSSAATIVRLFGVVIIIPPSFESHPPGERLYQAARSGMALCALGLTRPKDSAAGVIRRNLKGRAV